MRILCVPTNQGKRGADRIISVRKEKRLLNAQGGKMSQPLRNIAKERRRGGGMRIEDDVCTNKHWVAAAKKDSSDVSIWFWTLE